MENLLVNIIVSIIDNFVLLQILNYYLSIKHNSWHYLFLFVFSVFAIIFNTMEKPFILLMAITIFNLYAQINYKDTQRYKMVICNLVFAINVFLSFTIIALLSACDQGLFVKLHNDALFYFSIVMISKFLLVFVFFLLKDLLKNRHPVRWNLVNVELVLFFFSIVYCFYAYVRDAMQAQQATILLISMLCLFSITLYVYAKYIGNLRYLDKQKILQKEHDDCLYHNEREGMLIGLNIKAFHDFKERILVLNDITTKLINQFPNNENIKALKDLLDGDNFFQLPMIVYTENNVLNEIINSKSYLMYNLNIKFQCFADNALKFIEKDDLVIIFSALFDNAIDMSKSQTPSSIKLVITEINPCVKIDLRIKSNLEPISLDDSYVAEIVCKYQGDLISTKIKEFVNYKIIFPLGKGGEENG